MILDEKQALALMNSDMQLWERSATKAEGTDITKSITLPWGIGEVTVQFQGVDNAIKRRSAAEQWGGIIRQRIKDRIDDEAVTARARQAAALRDAEAEDEAVGRADSGRSTSGGGSTSESAGETSASTEAVQAHAWYDEDDAPSGTDFLARRDWLVGRIGQAEAYLAKWNKELKAIEAALEVLNASED